MRALRAVLAILLAFFTTTTQAFMIDSDEYNSLVDYPYPKRSFDQVWRNIQMQMPGAQKRTESLSRARANAYYRLG